MLEKKRLTSELLRVNAARAEMDYIIEQKNDEIKRLKDAIAIQDAKAAELEEKLKALMAEEK